MISLEPGVRSRSEPKDLSGNLDFVKLSSGCATERP
jgi:hypothetical protein